MAAEKFLTVAEVATRIRRSKATVYGLLGSERLHGINIAGPAAKKASWLVAETALEAFLSGAPALGPDGRALLTVVPQVEVA